MARRKLRARVSARVAAGLPVPVLGRPAERVAYKKASGPARRILSAMVVLGIDPGTANTGYGVVARDGARLVALDGGVIETAAGRDPGERLATIHARVGALLDEYRPDALAVEDLYFGSNAHSAFAVGQARGVVILAAGQRGLPCCSYTPQQVKGAVCGSGRADKGQVQRMVQALLSLTDLPRPDHAADALAVAICHANGASLRAAAERAA
jgi:crossover junction endodeoxyribonuclease RuvC